MESPVENNRTGTLYKHFDPGSIYRNIVTKYGHETGIDIEVNGLCVHSMRATAATNALVEVMWDWMRKMRKELFIPLVAQWER